MILKYIDKEPVTAPLTLREYFRLCRLYYLANPHDFKDVPDDPKEAYLQFADGRTEQMQEVELDDSQDFYDWIKKQGRWVSRSIGGHPCEISAKTYLFPRFTDGLNGHYVLRSFIWHYHKVITLCREPNLILSDKEYLIEIINGNGMLEVTPSLYRYGYPNSEYDEPVRYGDMTKKQKSKIVWDELTEARIKRRTNGDKV